MPENRKALQRRVKAVKNTQQITKAMQMISAAKLRRAQEAVVAARPYTAELRKALGRLVGSGFEIDHPLLQKREVANPTVGYVVIAADRGLAGGYNVNIIRKANQAIRELRAKGQKFKVYAVGRKVRDAYRRIEAPIAAEWVGLGEEARFSTTKAMVDKIIADYLNGDVDEVRLVYTEFVNAVTQRPVEIQLLPITAPEEEAGALKLDYIYAPTPKRVLETLVPAYASTVFFQAMLESKASEHGARMSAMKAATDNAKELISKLTLAMNKARQAAITREISEIVGGAEALS
jgi:F-type H+-transporting ATPase subunit gamma